MAACNRKIEQEAEALVRSVFRKFNQHADEDTVRKVAAKVMHAVLWRRHSQ